MKPKAQRPMVIAKSVPSPLSLNSGGVGEGDDSIPCGAAKEPTWGTNPRVGSVFLRHRRMFSLIALLAVLIFAVTGCGFGGGQKQPEPSQKDVEEAVAKELRTPDMQQIIKNNIQQDQVAQMVEKWLASDQGKQAVQKALAEVIKQEETKQMMSKAIQEQLKDPTTQRDIQDSIKETLEAIIGRGLAVGAQQQSQQQQQGGQKQGGSQSSGGQSGSGGQ